MKELSPFEKAFKEARYKGLKEFPFKGEVFHTRTYEEDNPGGGKDPGKPKRKPGEVAAKAASTDGSKKKPMVDKKSGPSGSRQNMTKGATKADSKAPSKKRRARSPGAASEASTTALPKKKSGPSGSRESMTKGATKAPSASSTKRRARSPGATRKASATELPKKKSGPSGSRQNMTKGATKASSTKPRRRPLLKARKKHG